MIEAFILFTLTFSLGYYLGGKGKAISEEVKESLSNLIKDKPRPGVVNKLTEEQMEEKHNPVKAGNKASFDRFFRDNPIK